MQTNQITLADHPISDPIVGAQYRWMASFAPFARLFLGLLQGASLSSKEERESYPTSGWITVSAWMFSATPSVLPNFITGLAVLFNPNY